MKRAKQTGAWQYVHNFDEGQKFWEEQDLTERPIREVNLQVDISAVRYPIDFEPMLLKELSKIARAQRKSLSEIVNEWLQEKLAAIKPQRAQTKASSAKPLRSDFSAHVITTKCRGCGEKRVKLFRQ